KINRPSCLTLICTPASCMSSPCQSACTSSCQPSCGGSSPCQEDSCVSLCCKSVCCTPVCCTPVCCTPVCCTPVCCKTSPCLASSGCQQSSCQPSCGSSSPCQDDCCVSVCCKPVCCTPVCCNCAVSTCPPAPAAQSPHCRISHCFGNVPVSAAMSSQPHGCFCLEHRPCPLHITHMPAQHHLHTEVPKPPTRTPIPLYLLNLFSFLGLSLLWNHFMH
uniref:Uncharacterized protein n=1 Tax=Ailuropoda melanoleuca TaxID=9646 RepID=A0A7N5JSX8_AILME